ncbi:MAG: hypothetical protein ACYTHN_15245 [Planctomycetota bacterium]
MITINEGQNGMVYYVNGDLWFDSDGDNHIFFVPGPGVERVNITIVAEGNIYVGDQIFVTTNTVNDQQFVRNIGGSTSAEAYGLTDAESGIALIAMADGESYNDLNKNGLYDEGETIIGRDNPDVPVPADQAPCPPGMFASDYQGRAQGSGNIIFGDTISGPVGVVEAFMFAENNFCDITADTSYANQNPYIFGNMTAGNRVYLNRNTEGWVEKPSYQVNDLPSDWTYSRWEDGVEYFYPPGTNDQNYDNPFVTYRRAYRNGNKFNVQMSRHNPLDLMYDERLEQGVINLPGLPHSNQSVLGSWKIIIWKQY